MRLTLERLNGIQTEKYTPKQLASLLDVRLSTLCMFIKRHNLKYKSRQYKTLSGFDKKRILSTVSPDLEICKVASKLGLERYMVQNFIKSNDLPYKGKKEDVVVIDYFTWEQYPNGIY